MQLADPAPVVLFAYKRCDHLKATVESLARNPLAARTQLHVFSDGPRTAADQSAVDAVRAYIATIGGFARVTTVAQASNKGLAASIIAGVTRMLRDHDRVIVLEDDMVVSPYFLAYMNDGLTVYERDETVASIHGYMYPNQRSLPETFFLRGADCWGWATWRRAWQHFDPDGAALLKKLQERGLMNAFNHHGIAPFREMLERQIAGKNDSWAIRWHAACYLDGLLTLYPGRTLVHNIGNDGSGTHGADSNSQTRFGTETTDRPVTVTPVPVVESQQGLEAVRDFFRSAKPGFPGRVLRAAQRLWGRIQRMATV